jgi:hypothetical protein
MSNVINLGGSEYSVQLANSLAERPDGIYDVDKYGAAGDGATDDSGAIQSAIDACEAADGGTVVLPNKSYVVDTTLTIDEGYGVKLVGTNPGGTWLVAGSNLTTSMLDIGVTTKSNTVEIGHIKFVNEAASTLTAAIRIGDGRGMWIHDLDFRDDGGAASYGFNYGILVDSSLNNNIGLTQSVIERLSDTGSGGIDTAMVKANEVVGVTLRDFRMSRNATYGVMIDTTSGGACQDNRIYNIHPEAGAGTPTAVVYLKSSADGNITLNKVWGISGQNTTDYGVSTDSTAGVIHSNTFEVPDFGFDTSSFNQVDDYSGRYRNIYNGVAYNSGDPDGNGNWNNNGYEGLWVVDTAATPDDLYLYVNSAWMQVV